MVSKLSTDLLGLIQKISREIEIPAVRRIATPSNFQEKDGDCGAVILDDGSMGFFYVLLDDTFVRLQALQESNTANPLRPETISDGISRTDPGARALALGAINAISQHVMRNAGLRLRHAGSLGGMTFDAADHVGLVGLFPSLAERFERDGVSFAVIEKRVELVENSPRYPVTLDPAELGGCNKILITASTLLNDTLDQILPHCGNASEIALIGPTAGCLPDLLFARGIHIVGSVAVVNPEVLPDRLQCGEPWGDTARKYVLLRDEYPGYEGLLESCSRHLGTRKISG